MEKTIFDKQYVYFMWDDEVMDKRCFVADDIDVLKRRVEHNDIGFLYIVKEPTIYGSFPFGANGNYRFVYYDPLYDIKWAWKQGKRIQCRAPSGAWLDIPNPNWDGSSLELRVKPDEPVYRPFKDIQELKSTFLNLYFSAAIPANTEPSIWVRRKANAQCTRMITGFAIVDDDTIVCIGTSTVSMYALLTEWEFLDGTPCGVKEE